MERQPCEYCKKSHYSFSARAACEDKHKKPDCTCPRYWRTRWPSHCRECQLHGQVDSVIEEGDEAA